MITVIDIGPEQIWRHYSGSLYEILHTASMEADGNCVVVYREVPSDDHVKDCEAMKIDPYGGMKIFVRPMDEWLGLAPKGSEQQERYVKVSGPDYANPETRTGRSITPSA